MMADSQHVCCIPDCGKPHKARGWCLGHYRRWRVHGDPMAGRVPQGGPLQFLTWASRQETDKCIQWPYLKEKGYGIIMRDGKRCRAHRLSLEMSGNPSPFDGALALHAPVICHNRSCINPRHLRWGSPAENMQDRIQDGTNIRGEKSFGSVLSENEVRRIRADSRATIDIAKDFGITRQNVRLIKKRITWSHVQ